MIDQQGRKGPTTYDMAR